MEHQAALPFLRETLLFLTLAGLLIPLLQRFNVNQVIGFLVIGLIIGPNGVGSLADHWPWLSAISFPRWAGVQALADLGVIFLMFLIGLELSLQRVWTLRRWVFGAGTVQVMLCGLVIGGFALAWGNSPQASLILGLVLSMSSTAIVMQRLQQQRALATGLGQACFSILMLQDFAVVPVLILVDLFVKQTSAGVMEQVAWTMLKSIGVVTFVLVGGRKLIGPLFRVFAHKRQPEVFMALTLLVALSTAGATAAAGLSMALGAFLAGLVLAETEYQHEVEVTVEPFKGLLMGLFFMSVGMGIDLRAVAGAPVIVALSVVGLMAIKAAITGAVLRSGGLSWGRALEGGMLLGQGGEFAFIVLGYATVAGLLPAPVGHFMLLVVSLSMLATPIVARIGQRWGQALHARGLAPDLRDEWTLPDASGHVVVIGFGRVGQLLGEVFAKQRVRYVAIEHDADLVAQLRAQGKPVSYGNAARPELLRKMGLSKAACLVVTMDQPMAAMHAVQVARSEYARLPIFARSRDETHARELRAAGATTVVPETLEAGLLLTSFALGSLGLPDAEVNAAITTERERRTRWT